MSSTSGKTVGEQRDDQRYHFAVKHFNCIIVSPKLESIKGKEMYGAKSTQPVTVVTLLPQRLWVLDYE